MADGSSQRSVALAGPESEVAELEQEELELALEFKDILRELAQDLAESAAAPSIKSVAVAVSEEIGAIGDHLHAELARELATLHEKQQRLAAQLQSQIGTYTAQSAAQSKESLESGLAKMEAALSQQVCARLQPLLAQLAALDQLESSLRDTAESASASAGKAAETLVNHTEESARSGDALMSALSSTTSALAGQATEVRNAVSSALPALEAAARGVQLGQDGLKTMLRTYNDTLDRSLTALETKFAGLLASNLERVTQRQAELEARMRATAERTEEAVMDLMQGNQAHHQAMVEGTAASLSQLEVFNKSFRQTTSGLKGLFLLACGAIVGLVFVSYLLLMRG